MSREIKFEFIWKHEGSIAKAKYDIDDIAKGAATPPRAREGAILRCWELLARRQFTGMLDKNGVEIYEGDIVYCVTKDPFGRPEQEATFAVELDYGSFLAMTASEEQFVIGNIHQNPELLGDK